MSGDATPETGRAWVVPAILGGVMLMNTLNSTVVYNALPTMSGALSEDMLHMNLVVTLFMMAATIFMPVSTWLADRFGARRMLLLAVVGFVIASAACGLSQTFPELLAARVAQGMTSAMSMPVARLVLLRTVPKHRLVEAMAVLMMPTVLGPVMGPLIGGAIVSFASWRWIFFINVPVAMLCVPLIRMHVPEVPADSATPRLDWIGVLLTAVGLGALILAVENLGRGALPPPVVAAMFGVAAVTLTVYWAHARRCANPILDMSLFKVRTFSTAVLGGATLRMSVGATPFLLAMLLQVCLGMSAFRAGMLTFASSAAGLLMKNIAPPVLRRFGFRKVMSLNALLVGVGYFAIAAFREGTAHWVMLTVLATGGVFRLLQFNCLNSLAFADLDQTQMSRGAATTSMVQQLLGSVGVGVTAALLQLAMKLRGETGLTTALVASAFAVVGAVTALSWFSFRRLPSNAGEHMHRPAAGSVNDL